MGVLTADMRLVLEQQQLGFIATVCPDGTPNLSPKGTTLPWDDDHLVFADISSPNTIANLRLNPAVEINVVDVLLRRGYRFKGVATVLSEGARFEEAMAFYRRRGSITVKHHIVLIAVQHAAEIVSPSYDMGQSETQVRGRWLQYWDRLWGR